MCSVIVDVYGVLASLVSWAHMAVFLHEHILK